MPTGDESNALAVAYYSDAAPDHLRAEFERLAYVILDCARLRSDAEMAATDAVAWAPGRPLWQFIAGDTFQHWPLHAATIEHAVQRKRSV